MPVRDVGGHYEMAYLGPESREASSANSILPGCAREVPITSFEKGKLKIAAQVREELELAQIPFESIHCKSGSLHIPPGIARLIVTVNECPWYLDLSTPEVEDCEVLVAAFIGGLKKR